MPPLVVAGIPLRKFSWLLICCAVMSIVNAGGALAQTGEGGWLTPPLTDKFPLVETSLVVFNQGGNFVHNLNETSIFLFEDGSQLPLLGLEEQRPGVQAVFVIDPGPSFAIQNSQGFSRYDFVVRALENWGKSRLGTTIDDLSLLTTGGSSASHVSSTEEWLTSLSGDQVDARTASPSLDSLFRAVNLAADPTVRPGMGRAIVYITPPPEGVLDESFENIITQAELHGIRIYIWMVASIGTYSLTAENQLINLATRTGGQFFSFSGEETLPDPETYFEPLRNIYHLTYESRISSTGAHKLRAQVQTSFGEINTPEQEFQFDIQPPLPMFISPPVSIKRIPPAEAGFQALGESDPDSFTPQEQVFSVVFDYPDGRIRPIVRSAMYVDGGLVAENKLPPFDQFVWNIQNYDTAGVHTVHVEAEDMLGLIGRSAEIPVEITLEFPAPNPWTPVYENLPVITILAVLMAGAVLFLVLVMGGRLRPQLVYRSKKRRRKSDPVTQPVKISDSSPSLGLASLANRLQWSGKQDPSQVSAMISPLSETGQGAPCTPIAITMHELTIGKNPDQAALVLDDPSIEELHARIFRNQDGTFLIADEKTNAGTWINFTPVSREGAQLEHGDLIHIGGVGFRFTLAEPSQSRKSVITKKSQSL